MSALMLDIQSLRNDYHTIGRAVLSRGRTVSPRGRETLERSPALLQFDDPTDSLPTGTGRGVIVRLAVVEALQLVACIGDPATLVAASPRYANFVDPETGKLEVAYGPRVGGQLDWAWHRLRDDHDTRQAHVDFWHPTRDKPGLRAYPCIVSCGFQIREERVELFVEMRSNDLWLGLPYDVFAFTQLQITMANVLGLEVGPYSHYARSLHVYMDNSDAANVEGLLPPKPIVSDSGFHGVSGVSMSDACWRAQAILRGEEPPGSTASERAYLKVMREQVLPKVKR